MECVVLIVGGPDLPHVSASSGQNKYTPTDPVDLDSIVLKGDSGEDNKTSEKS
ncbi:hypothetical protein KI387_014695, partial [Taxus chinensis]